MCVCVCVLTNCNSQKSSLIITHFTFPSSLSFPCLLFCSVVFIIMTKAKLQSPTLHNIPFLLLLLSSTHKLDHKQLFFKLEFYFIYLPSTTTTTASTLQLTYLYRKKVRFPFNATLKNYKQQNLFLHLQLLVFLYQTTAADIILFFSCNGTNNCFIFSFYLFRPITQINL